MLEEIFVLSGISAAKKNTTNVPSILLFLVGVAPFVGFYLTAWGIDRLRTLRLEMNRKLLSSGKLPSKWVCLFHRDDEAIGGLRSLGQVHFKIFKRNTVTAPLLLLASIFIPLVILWMNSAGPGNSAVLGFINYAFHTAREPVERALGIVIYPLVVAIKPSIDEPGADALSYAFIGPLSFMILLFATVLMALACLTPLSNAAASAACKVLDATTWNGIRQFGYGNDTPSESAVDGAFSPDWYDGEPSPLPSALSNILTGVADEAMAHSIPKLRRAIGRAAFSVSGKSDLENSDEIITWNELIHTTYFKVSIFRKLVCYAVAHSPGFRPSEKLKADPDYEKLGEWLTEIKGGSRTESRF